MPAAREPRSTALLIAGMLFAAGLLILIWPVSSPITGSDGGTSCGMAVSQAFRTPRGPHDPELDRTLDCASRARDRAGYAALFLLLSLPTAVVAIDDRLRTTRLA